VSVNIAYESGDLVCTNTEGAPVGSEGVLNDDSLPQRFPSTSPEIALASDNGQTVS